MAEKGPLPRGLIEVSNICSRNCLYCGIRRDAAVKRYHMTKAEVFAAIAEARRRGYPAIALQAGEIKSEENTQFYEDILKSLGTDPAESLGTGPMEVTLSLGEQSEETYRRWKVAAGERILRYLIRIESSDRELFAAIHPPEIDYDRRLECIRTLKRLGYVTGSGVMIGLPGQTRAHLEADLDFFERERLDMVGMGPYIPTPGTPLYDRAQFGSTRSGPTLHDSGRRYSTAIPSPAERLELSLWMIRETRRRMPHINIVAATSLDSLSSNGRALALAAGANVIMPILTPLIYRENYQLYPTLIVPKYEIPNKSR